MLVDVASSVARCCCSLLWGQPTQLLFHFERIYPRHRSEGERLNILYCLFLCVSCIRIWGSIMVLMELGVCKLMGKFPSDFLVVFPIFRLFIFRQNIANPSNTKNFAFPTFLLLIFRLLISKFVLRQTNGFCLFLYLSCIRIWGSLMALMELGVCKSMAKFLSDLLGHLPNSPILFSINNCRTTVIVRIQRFRLLCFRLFSDFLF